MRRSLNPGLLVALLAASVAALSGCADGNVGEMITGGPGGLCGLLILIADIYAIVKIAQSTADPVAKVLWALLVFFFPVGGLLIWYFFGPKG